jgi:hypothetical protein
MPYNGLGLCEEAELEAQMFSLVLLFIRIPIVQFSTEPAFLQNPCYALVPFFVCSFCLLLSCRGALAW